MNREEIEDWREWLVADVRLENRAGANELCDLAARALELEKVLSEAKYVVRQNDAELVNGLVILRAAIDRVEGL